MNRCAKAIPPLRVLMSLCSGFAMGIMSRLAYKEEASEKNARFSEENPDF